MKWATIYLICFLSILGLLLLSLATYELPIWLQTYNTLIASLIIGGIGGCVYLLRSVYIHYSALSDWNDKWLPWYYIRPIVSIVIGGISYIFLRAGLFILESAPKSDSNEYGFLAVAFIAGYKVDKFLEWLENTTYGSLTKNKSDKTKNR